ncbi:biotin--[acetyl-CoA-carboxylase] ligase [Rhodoligotrophos defluvii]|uniref:biotin--[acetyl-CoA-carboxylase] ligase n=1 Tax=Rhodoligotrophos defluvii TaxID=2561934 RepID=UPI0010C96596|nr:biotin--[acetyl-CoA-carboxylase] ligase [Rhodoligotrophos defluvii]
MAEPNAPAVPQGYRLAVLDEIDSTNAEAMRRALAGDHGPLWLMARRQTGGRGRYGRHWVSEPGNLYTSLMMTAPAAHARLANLSFVAALALSDAVAQLLDEPARSQLRLKWPNDLLIAGAKTSGILLEAQPLPNSRELALALGFGVNIDHRPSLALPYAATFLAEHGVTVTPGGLLQLLAERFDHWHRTWTGPRGFAPVREAWLARAQGVGAPIEVKLQGETIHGIFEDLDDDGALVLLLSNGQRRKILAGDVFLR